jgi:hypothetical protein
MASEARHGIGPVGGKSHETELGKSYLGAQVREAEQGNHISPTPTTQDDAVAAYPSQFKRDTIPLHAVVKLQTSYPTPRGGAQGVGLCGGTGAYEKLKGLAADGSITDDECHAMASRSGGQLNPDWVEPLMGYRCGTTVIVPEIEAWLKIDSKRLKASDLKALHSLDEHIEPEVEEELPVEEPKPKKKKGGK